MSCVWIFTGSAKTKAQDEADKLRSSIEKDQHQIHTLLNRRVFIQYCSLLRNSMWHELRVVLHNRENALLSLAIQQFVREESEFSGRVHSTWTALSDEVESIGGGEYKGSCGEFERVRRELQQEWGMIVTSK
ncbi:hypothetical protein AG1IA_09825 [Rhizoctonia solani AG-1 IA]|uniref:Uncharacterized protein n=1 Tax=Thanatephorus cucumeris (strain AG1-IA) TaxID=983506 RepID=L8WDX0_THACA|nr:hypothetical protein AG1IA_09825 [Rhizoctonia solani AG-1 IA]